MRTGPCIDPIFGPTDMDAASCGAYWSTTQLFGAPVGEWVVQFSNGAVGNLVEYGDQKVRAVPGGL